MSKGPSPPGPTSWWSDLKKKASAQRRGEHKRVVVLLCAHGGYKHGLDAPSLPIQGFMLT